MSNPSVGQGLARGRVPAAQRLRYVARQPIFDRQEKVFGYELLFRDGLENAFSGDLDEASRVTLDRSLLIGLDVLCDGRRAFVNCTRDTLLKGLVTLLPATSTVVEVLETVPADPEVVAACRSLKDAGYMIALDDYGANDPREALADLADIIKVEMLLTTEEERTGLMKRLGAGRCRMLAEKIETHAEFMRAGSGICVFPGIFFSPSGDGADPRHAGEPTALPAHAAGGIAAATEFRRTGKAGEGGGLVVLPPAALFEFADVQLSK